jgi:transcriptional regulator with XRE-family HTH domain
MPFGEKLKQLRLSAHMTQKEAAEGLGVSFRMYQYYEAGEKYPKNAAVYTAAARLFGVTSDYLLGDTEMYVLDARAKGGAKSQKEVKELVTEIGGLFAGGELSDDDKDKVMRTINDLYWQAKENNKKYTPKKYQR